MALVISPSKYRTYSVLQTNILWAKLLQYSPTRYICFQFCLLMRLIFHLLFQYLFPLFSYCFWRLNFLKLHYLGYLLICFHQDQANITASSSKRRKLVKKFSLPWTMWCIYVTLTRSSKSFWTMEISFLPLLLWFRSLQSQGYLLVSLTLAKSLHIVLSV